MIDAPKSFTSRGISHAAETRRLNDLLTAAESGSYAGSGNNTTEVLNSFKGQSFSDMSTVPRTDSFWAILVLTGPNGESDFTNARYWVQAIYFDQSRHVPNVVSKNLAPSLGWDDTEEGYRWLPATNLSEDNAESHRLIPTDPKDPTVQTAIIVKVYAVQGMVLKSSLAVPYSQYVFIKDVAKETISFYITSATGTVGLYNAKSIKGPASTTSFGSKSGVEDLLVWNGAETSSIVAANNLLISPNTTTFDVMGSGTVQGIDAATGKKIVNTWMGFARCSSSGPSPSDGSV